MRRIIASFSSAYSSWGDILFRSQFNSKGSFLPLFAVNDDGSPPVLHLLMSFCYYCYPTTNKAVINNFAG